MEVYRISLSAYARRLAASGRPGRWNPPDTFVIYTAGSRSLACLENVVHRSGIGLQGHFTVLTILIPDSFTIQSITTRQLPGGWQGFDFMPGTQQLGAQWLAESKTCVLKVPSAIIPDEYNYLLSPLHPLFTEIRITARKPFLFDKRIKA